MHFFYPVHRMPLVEIIRGEQTSDETIAKVVAYATSRMGKTPIVVKTAGLLRQPRTCSPYFAVSACYARRRFDFRQIDKVMRKTVRLADSPAYLLDVEGIDTAHHAQAVIAAGFPDA